MDMAASRLVLTDGEKSSDRDFELAGKLEGKYGEEAKIK
jgi:hypothetical protein